MGDLVYIHPRMRVGAIIELDRRAALRDAVNHAADRVARQYFQGVSLPRTAITYFARLSPKCVLGWQRAGRMPKPLATDGSGTPEWAARDLVALTIFVPWGAEEPAGASLVGVAYVERLAVWWYREVCPLLATALGESLSTARVRVLCAMLAEVQRCSDPHLLSPRELRNLVRSSIERITGSAARPDTLSGALAETEEQLAWARALCVRHAFPLRALQGLEALGVRDPRLLD